MMLLGCVRRLVAVRSGPLLSACRLCGPRRPSRLLAASARLLASGADPRPSQDEPRPSRNDPRPSRNDPRPSRDEPRPSQDEPRPSQDELQPPPPLQSLTPAQRLVAACPPAVQPYLQLMRVDRPIGSWLLFWPCGWGLAQAAPPGCLPDPTLLAIYAAGAFIMRGAGCTINDMWDRDIDSKVERTRSRPITSGRVSVLDALVFLSAQMSVGALLLLQLNWPTLLLGVSSLSLVMLYPLMKRVTHWPQLVLGLTFNWGVLMAWASAQGSVAWLAALPLYTAGVCWTIVYDTIYAHQDKADDLALGMKSTALRFGDATPRWLAGFGAAMMTSLVAAGATAGQSWPYYLGLSAVGLHVGNQVRTLKTYDAADCGDKFRSNRYVGLLLFISIVAGRWLGAGDDSAVPEILALTPVVAAAAPAPVPAAATAAIHAPAPASAPASAPAFATASVTAESADA